MTATVRAALISACILVIGLAAVHLEVTHTKRGTAIRRLLLDHEAALERVRRLELRYNGMVSPDILESRKVKDFQLEEVPSAIGGQAATPAPHGGTP